MAADDSVNDGSKVEQASFSTGKAGSRLKWLARRPKSEEDGAAVNGAEYDAGGNGAPSGQSCAAQDEQPTSKTWSKSVERPPMPVERGGNQIPETPGKKVPDQKSLLERELMPRRNSLSDKCPSPRDLKHINELGTDINPPPPPPDWGENNHGVPNDCPLGDETFKTRQFAPITYTWTASALCHKPLYFEDVQLERYGHMGGPWLQPFASAANFFCTFPILPYKMGLELPNECMYTLGYYRPGDCAPYLFDPLPISVRATFYEGIAWTGLVWMMP